MAHTWSSPVCQLLGRRFRFTLQHNFRFISVVNLCASAGYPWYWRFLEAVQLLSHQYTSTETTSPFILLFHTTVSLFCRSFTALPVSSQRPWVLAYSPTHTWPCRHPGQLQYPCGEWTTKPKILLLDPLTIPLIGNLGLIISWNFYISWVSVAVPCSLTVRLLSLAFCHLGLLKLSVLWALCSLTLTLLHTSPLHAI